MMRQQHVHGLRQARVSWVKKLQEQNYNDTDALGHIIHINGQIDMLKKIREPYPDFKPEPTVEEIEARGLSWYWEEWREDADIPEDEAEEEDADGNVE